MSIEDEIYFELHSEELREEYQDYLIENDLSEAEFSFADFRNEL